MEQIKIDVVKQWLINKKEFSPLEVIEELEKENAELKAQIKKMKCCENCNRYRKAKCTEDNMFYSRTTRQCKEWEQAE